MANVPLSGTNIRLLSGVPFSNDYKHTRWFDTKSQQTNYFLNKPVIHLMTQANFQKIDGKNFIAVNKDVDSLWGTNYIMFQNSHYSDKWFYGFVTKIEYIQRNNTHVHFEIDVFQTWKFEMTFKPSFVVREHCKLWNDDGTPIINTVDEGLNYGDEYDTVYQYQYKPNDSWKWLVIITKTMLHGELDNVVFPSSIGTIQPLSYYIVPFMDGYPSIAPTIKPNSLDASETVTDAISLLEELYKNENAVNNIVSIYTSEYLGFDYTISGNNITLQDGDVLSAEIKTIGTGFKVLRVGSLKEFRPKHKQINTNKYEGFRTVKESKLLMYPYAVTILDDFKGNRIEVKHEYISKPDLKITMRGSLGTSNKMSYAVANYNADFTDEVDSKLSLEYGIVDTNPNDVPVLTDYLASFLQGNRNSLQAQKNAIMFNGAMNTINNASNIIPSAVSGDIGSGVGSLVNVAQGGKSTVLQLQSIMAKQKDIANVPPQISNMGSNTAFDFGNRYNGIWILKKQIKPEYQKKLEQFFSMFGYKLNEVKIPNFHTRQNWNYVQTESCIITGSFNNEELQEIKNVFDRGITFWHTDDIGNYSLSNEVI